MLELAQTSNRLHESSTDECHAEPEMCQVPNGSHPKMYAAGANLVVGRKAGTYPSSFISDGRTERSVAEIL